MELNVRSRVLGTVDAGDPIAIAALFADDGRFTFGNNEPVVGRAAIEAAIGAFFGTIDGLEHQVMNELMVGADTVVEAEGRYRRLDGKEVVLPTASIWRTRSDGLIEDYRVYADLTPVYAP